MLDPEAIRRRMFEEADKTVEKMTRYMQSMVAGVVGVDDGDECVEVVDDSSDDDILTLDQVEYTCCDSLNFVLTMLKLCNPICIIALNQASSSTSTCRLLDP